MTTKMKAPEGVTSFGIEGTDVEINDGVADVPKQHIATAMSHGFVHYVEEAQAIRKGMRVSFDSEGVTVVGNVKKIAKGVAVVVDDEAGEWTVEDMSILTVVE